MCVCACMCVALQEIDLPISIITPTTENEARHYNNYSAHQVATQQPVKQQTDGIQFPFVYNTLWLMDPDAQNVCLTF